MEWYGSVVSWVKLDLWFCFEKGVFLAKNWPFLLCLALLCLGGGPFA